MVSQVRTLEELIALIKKEGLFPVMDRYMANEPTQQQIAAKAEEIYKKRLAENKPGDSLSDWYEAEKELREPVFRY